MGHIQGNQARKSLFTAGAPGLLFRRPGGATISTCRGVPRLTHHAGWMGRLVLLVGKVMITAAVKPFARHIQIHALASATLGTLSIPTMGVCASHL
jgi:hypothetical protein